jgi:hypothetical protein
VRLVDAWSSLPQPMWEPWNEEEVELDGHPLILTGYPVANSFVTQIEAQFSGAILALSIGATERESRTTALQSARKRLLGKDWYDLMVGG